MKTGEEMEKILADMDALKKEIDSIYDKKERSRVEDRYRRLDESLDALFRRGNPFIDQAKVRRD